MIALLSGCDTYKYISNLSLCEADVLAVKKVLLDRDVPEENIIVLLNEEDTTVKWQTAFRYVVSHEDSNKLVYNASHGSNKPSKTEADGLDELICTYDIDFRGNFGIVDDWIATEVAQLSEDSVLTFISASCHSGDLYREIYRTGKNRYYPSSIHDYKRSRRTRRGKNREIIHKLEGSRLRYLAACTEAETAMETHELGHEVMTAYMLKSLHKNPTISFASLVEEVTEALKAQGFNQHPQASSSEALQQLPFLMVKD